MTKIIGITGKAGAGKDTLAASLAAYLGTTETLTFADPIREIAYDLGLSIYDRDKKEQEVSLRFAHFELALIEAVIRRLDKYLGEDDLCDLYAHVTTYLRNTEYLKTGRQDVLRISPRRFCQILGTEGGRRVRPTLWIDVLRARAKRSRADYVLVPDVRFHNEAGVCDLTIGIFRDVPDVEDHASERDIPDLIRKANCLYRNEGTIADLQRYAESLSADIRGGYLLT